MLNGLSHRTYTLPECIQNLKALQEKSVAIDLEGRLLYTRGWRFILLSLLSGADEVRVNAIRSQTEIDLDTIIKTEAFSRRLFLAFYYRELKALGYSLNELKRKIQRELAAEEVENKTGRFPIEDPENWAAYVNQLQTIYRPSIHPLTLYYALGRDHQMIAKLYRAQLNLLQLKEEDQFTFTSEGITRISAYPLRAFIEQDQFDWTLVGLKYLPAASKRKPTFYEGAKRLSTVKDQQEVVDAVLKFVAALFNERKGLETYNLDHFVFYKGALYSLYPEKRSSSFNYRALYNFIYNLWGENREIFEGALREIALRQSKDFRYFLSLVRGDGQHKQVLQDQLLDTSLIYEEKKNEELMKTAIKDRKECAKEAEETGLFFIFPESWFSKVDTVSEDR